MSEKMSKKNDIDMSLFIKMLDEYEKEIRIFDEAVKEHKQYDSHKKYDSKKEQPFISKLK